MKRFLYTTLSTVAVGGALMLAGCGSTPSENSTTTTTTTTTGDATANSTAAANTDTATSGDRKLRVTVIPKGLIHSFWQAVKRGAEDAGKEMNVEINWNGPSSESQGVNQEIQIVEDAITKNVDGILIAPIDRQALVPVIDKAAAKKIPLVIFDSDAQTKNRLSFVATDNYKGGVIAAERLAKIVGGKGEVGIVPVQANSQSTEDREKGFEDTIKKKYPNIKVWRSQYGQSDRTISQNVTQDMLTAHPNIVAIFGPNESSISGALSAVRNRKVIGKVKLVGFDSAPVLEQALKNGEIDSLVLQNPYKMGYEGVRVIVDNANKKPITPRIDTGVVLVTKENMNTPENKKLLQ